MESNSLKRLPILDCSSLQVGLKKIEDDTNFQSDLGIFVPVEVFATAIKESVCIK